MDIKSLLIKAQDARESGNFLESLQILDEALILFENNSNADNFVEISSAKVLTLRHIYDKNGDKNLLILAKHVAMAAVEVARNTKVNVAMALYNLGKVQESLGEIIDAIDSIKDAISNASDGSEKFEMETRFAVLEYRNEDNEAAERFYKALEDLKTSQYSDEYTQNVWVSGAYMHMAEALFDKDEKGKANELLDKAIEVIGDDGKYKLRRDQISGLKKKNN